MATRPAMKRNSPPTEALASQRAVDPVFDGSRCGFRQRAIIDERVFSRMIYLERRRSERSGHALLLVLLNDVSARDAKSRNADLWSIANQLCLSVRETDFVGWYKNRSTVGVLFSDLTIAEAGVVNALLSKVSAVIESTVAPQVLAAINISTHVFPEVAGDGSGPVRLLVYPDGQAANRPARLGRLAKRVIDIIGSTFLLLVCSPIILLSALAIKVSSEGPVIFRQVRLGANGKPFTCLKFRSMYSNTSAALHQEYVRELIKGRHTRDGAPGIYKIQNDPRITPIGRILRKASFDELPQLWNVLRGEISLVGPRPPVPYEFDAYALWHRRRILEATPGLTGLWQVGGRSRVCFDDMVRLDLRYIMNWSIWLDLKILLQTPRAVFGGEGAY